MATSPIRKSTEQEASKIGNKAGGKKKARPKASASRQSSSKPATADRPRPGKARDATSENDTAEAGGGETKKKKSAARRNRAKGISRKELVERALEKLKAKLDSTEEVTPATIGALEKLLKLDREILEEKEMPQEIRVLWEEINGESSEDQ